MAEEGSELALDRPKEEANESNLEVTSVEFPPKFSPRLEVLHQLQATEEEARKGQILCQRSKEGVLDQVKQLVLDGAAICYTTTSGWTPLSLACFNGHLEVQKQLQQQQ
jgi:ankyrin repeat protein